VEYDYQALKVVFENANYVLVKPLMNDIVVCKKIPKPFDCCKL